MKGKITVGGEFENKILALDFVLESKSKRCIFRHYSSVYRKLSRTPESSSGTAAPTTRRARRLDLATLTPLTLCRLRNLLIRASDESLGLDRRGRWELAGD